MDVNARIEGLERELQRLKREVGEPAAGTSRRRLFQVGAAAAGGAVLAAVGARPAAAADGDEFVIGETNEQNTTDSTVLHYTAADAPIGSTPDTTGNILLVSDQDTLDASSPPFDDTTTVPPAAIAGYGTRVAPIGVLGVGAAEAAWGGAFAGTQANVNLVPAGDAPAARTDAAAMLGDLVNDSTGALWLCVASSTPGDATTEATPGVFRQLAGPTAAGALHLLEAPVRAFDTRPPEQSPVGNNMGKLQKDGEYVVDLAAEVNGVRPVPAGATAVLVNLTATLAEAPGFLALFADDVEWPGTSNLNFMPDTDVANLAVSRVSADGRLRVRAGGADATVRTHVIVDVIGYYL